MGITMMGGFMSWLWVIQAFLIAVLFLTGNYYLWIGMGRIPGAERFRPYTKYLLIVLVLGAIVWGTRSEEHTSELQSQSNLVCRLLLEKKKKNNVAIHELQLCDYDRPVIHCLNCSDERGTA